MADHSKIEWTDATWNPITGCTPISEGCRNCYAERMAKRFPGLHNNGSVPVTMMSPDEFRTPVFHASRLDQPIRWQRPRRIFVGSMTDLFHPEIPLAWLTDVMQVMDRARQHTFLVLTKRPERMKAYLDDVAAHGGPPPPHIWWGVTTENQKAADERIPVLLQATPRSHRFVSVEPMIGPVDLDSACHKVGLHLGEAISWVICGGESGPGARPVHPRWPSMLRIQCEANGVPFFFKQWGEWVPVDMPWRSIDAPGPLGRSEQWLNLAGGMGFHGQEVWRMSRVGKKQAGFLLDGAECKEFPISDAAYERLLQGETNCSPS